MIEIFMKLFRRYLNESNNNNENNGKDGKNEDGGNIANKSFKEVIYKTFAKSILLCGKIKSAQLNCSFKHGKLIKQFVDSLIIGFIPFIFSIKIVSIKQFLFLSKQIYVAFLFILSNPPTYFIVMLFYDKFLLLNY